MREKVSGTGIRAREGVSMAGVEVGEEKRGKARMQRCTGAL